MHSKLMKIKKNPKILSRKEGKKFLLFNPVSRQILFLSEYAFNIWNKLDDKKELDKYLADFNIDSKDLNDFLKELKDKNLAYDE